MVDFIVIDSIASLNRSLDLIKTTIKLISSNPDLTLFFTNQTRSSRYSNTEAAGSDYFHSMCNLIIRVSEVKRNLWIGSTVRYEIERFKPNPKLQKSSFTLYYNSDNNLSNETDLIMRAQENKIIVRSGTKFIFENVKYSLNELLNNIDVLIKIWNLVITPLNAELKPHDYLGRSLTNTTI
jgi:hypothetical protein